MKKLLSLIILSLMLTINNVQAFDEINGNKTELNVTFSFPENGIDNEDYILSYEEIYGNKEK